MHLVGFVIRTDHDALSPERQTHSVHKLKVFHVNSDGTNNNQCC